MPSSTTKSLPRPCIFVKRSFATRSDVEPEMHDVAVLDDVFAALEAHLAVLLGAVLALACDEVGEGDHLNPDEPPLEVGVDRTRGLRGGRPDRDRPRTHFLRARGEIRLEAEELVS